jgi:elongation factor Ts
MQVARAVRYESPHGASVHAYIHPGARVGVLIEAAADKPGARDAAPFQQLIHDLAMQVAAAQPRFVSREQVDAATLEKEREIARAQLKDSNKPAQVIEKIVEGKLNKFYEEACLVDQPFIKAQDSKVRDIILQVGKELGAAVTVTRFARFVLGESF